MLQRVLFFGFLRRLDCKYLNVLVILAFEETSENFLMIRLMNDLPFPFFFGFHVVFHIVYR